MKDQYCHPKCCHDLFAEEKVLSKTFLADGKKHLLLSVMKSFFQEPQKVYSWGFSMWQKKLLLLYPILYILSYINKWQTFMPTALALLGKQVNAKRASHFFVLIAAVFATIHSFITHLFGMENITYSQNHVKCSRPLCSLPGLQGQNFFADAIISFLILFESISDKNWYDELFINKVVKIFTF